MRKFHIIAVFCAVFLICNVCRGETPDWLGSKEGITDKVLAPWTPVKAEQNKDSLRVDVWGRSYEFNKSIFPSRVKTQDKLILQKPIIINAQVEGRTVDWVIGRPQLQESTPAKTVFSTEAVTRDGRLGISAKTVIEYDGMIRVDWKLLPKTKLKLDDLTFEFTMPEQFATLFYTYTGRNYYPQDSAYVHVNPTDPSQTYTIGALPEKGVRRSFTPSLWLGNEEVGLAWCCESDRNWFNSDPENSIEILKAAGNVVVRLHLVTTGIELTPGDTTLSYTFGLQATPAKRTERDSWDTRTATPPLYGRDYAVLTEKIRDQVQIDRLKQLGVRTLILFNWTDYLCYTRPLSHDKDLRDTVKACHDRGIQVLLYLGNQVSENAPEWPEYGDQIVWAPRYRQQDRYPNQTPQWVDYVCLRSVWQDFLVHGVARLIDDYDIDGVYLDGTSSPMPCENELHGCGYRDSNGKLHRTYPIFATRDAIRRIYTTVKSKKPAGQVILHIAGGYLSPPIINWSMGYWCGETLSADVFTMDDSSLDLFRVELMGHQWGLSSYLLRGGHGPTLAYTLLHDTLPLPHGPTIDGKPSDIDVISQLWTLSDKFGRKEATWRPYWNNKQYVNVGAEGAYVSLHTHPKNGVLAVVSNLSGQEATVDVNFNLAKLGLRGNVTATDAMTESPIPIEKGTVRLKLSSPGFKLIWLK